MAIIAAIVIGADLAAGTEEPPAKSKPETELGKLAAGMQPGEIRKLNTKGFTRELTRSWYDWDHDEKGARIYGAQAMFNVFESWSHDATWDPVTRQVMFIGIGHYAAMKFITYSADTNEWTLRPVPTWADPRLEKYPFPGRDLCGRDQKTGNRTWPRGHTYDRLAIDPTNRLFVINWHGLRLYHIDKGEWSLAEGADAGGKDAHQVCGFFPERNIFIYESSWGKNLRSWNVETKNVSPIGSYASYGFGIHGIIQHNPVHKVIVWGLGDGFEFLYRMDADGKVVKLKQAPIHVNCRNEGAFFCDPVSGEYVVQEFKNGGGGQVFAFHPMRDEWREIKGLVLPTGLCVAIPEYGVAMMAGGGGVHLYKHKPQFSDEPAKGSDAK